MSSELTRTARTRLRRRPKRGHYDRETIWRLLDAGVIAHVGYVVDGQPYVTPTMYWRHEDRVYWHGSSASRMLRMTADGAPVCFSVTHFDGLVLARSGFNHSANYRSLMAFGVARQVRERAEKLAALEGFVERLFPGRWPQLRPATPQELRATTVLWMRLIEASAKVRTGPPLDDEADRGWPCWAGVVPVATVVGAPEPDPQLMGGIELPAYLRNVAFEPSGGP